MAKHLYNGKKNNILKQNPGATVLNFSFTNALTNAKLLDQFNMSSICWDFVVIKTTKHLINGYLKQP